MFSKPEMPAAPGAGAPPPPPNPPTFGSNTPQGQKQRKKAQQSTGFSDTIMGDAGPASVSNKTLIGQ